MARIKIELPDSFTFETTLKVRIYDLNYGAHLGNDRLLAFMHEARMQFLKNLGYENEKDSIEGLGIIMVDAAVVYKSESFFDDQIKVSLGIGDVEKYSLDFVYLLSHSLTGKEIARGKTAIACFDYNIRKINAIPESFKEDLLR